MKPRIMLLLTGPIKVEYCRRCPYRPLNGFCFLSGVPISEENLKHGHDNCLLALWESYYKKLEMPK